MFFKKREVAPPPPILHAYDDDFDVLVSEVPGIAVVDFWASWCRPCVMMEPIYPLHPDAGLLSRR